MNKRRQRILLNYHMPILLSYVALILLLNWPLVTHIRTHIFGRIAEDSFEVLWQLSWMKTAVFEQQVNPFYSPNVFYPQGWHLASGAQPSWFILLLAPVTKVLGVVPTHNLTLLGTFVLAGFGVYLLAHHLTYQRLPSFIAGCVYVSAPVLTMRLGGHTHILISMAFLPYAALGFYRACGQENRQWAWIILAGITLALTILGMWYFLFIATLPLIALALFIASPITWRERMLRLILIGLVTLLCILPFAVITWNARQEMFPYRGDMPLVQSVNLGLSPNYLFAPNLNHPLWGDWSAQYFPIRGEQSFVSVGYVGLALATIGLAFTNLRKTRPFVAMGIVALVLAMGLTLNWNNAMVKLSVPIPIASMLQRLYADIRLLPDQVAIPLPGLFLYHLLPFYAAMRAWVRFDIPFMLALAILSSYGANFLVSKGRNWSIVLVIAGLLILFEGATAPYIYFTDVADNNRSANHWLADQPTGTQLIEYPRPQVDKIAMYSQSLHGQQVVNGYMSIEPTYLQDVSSQLGEWPKATALPILRDWEVQYIVVSSGSANTEHQETILPHIDTLEGLCHIQSFDDGFMWFNQTHIYELISTQETCPD